MPAWSGTLRSPREHQAASRSQGASRITLPCRSLLKMLNPTLPATAENRHVAACIWDLRRKVDTFRRTCGARVLTWRGHRVRPVLLPVRAEAAGLAVEDAELGTEPAGHGGRDVAGVSARCVSGHSSCTWPLHVPDAGAMFPSVDRAVGPAPGALVAPSAAGAPRASDTLQRGYSDSPFGRRLSMVPVVPESVTMAGRPVRRCIDGQAFAWSMAPGSSQLGAPFEESSRAGRNCAGIHAAAMQREPGAARRCACAQRGEHAILGAGDSPGPCAPWPASMPGKRAAEGRTRGERYRPNPARIPVTCCI